MKPIKKITSGILIAIIMVFTLVAILGIWDVIELENIIKKTLLSLFVVFIASVVVLFIINALFKDNDER